MVGCASKAAKLLPPGSVDAVDLNCGCPQALRGILPGGPSPKNAVESDPF